MSLPVFRRSSHRWLICLLLLIVSAQGVWAQDRFESLYAAPAIQKHRIKVLTIELFAGLQGLDSATISQRGPDYRERYDFDEMGRPVRYQAADINIGSQGPQIVSRYEYSENGRVRHRHDSTAYGHASEWQSEKDSLGRRRSETMFLPGGEAPHITRQYLYDPKGRLHKLRTQRDRSAEGLPNECVWMFYVYDAHSFNATSLSPMEMARCQCNLEYLDDQGRPVRRVVYDSTATIIQNLLLNYDRTGKPSRIESRDPSGSVLHASVDITYGRSGVVIVEAKAADQAYVQELARLGMAGQAFVTEHWDAWRLIRELRIRIGGEEWQRYYFTYQQAP